MMLLIFSIVFFYSFFNMSNSILFTPKKLGILTVPNRFMRSATMEALSDSYGLPKKELFNLI